MKKAHIISKFSPAFLAVAMALTTNIAGAAQKNAFDFNKACGVVFFFA